MGVRQQHRRPQQRKQSHPVRFASKNTTHDIPSFKALPPREREKLWFTAIEIETLAVQADECVVRAEENNSVVDDTTGDIVRGLERKTDDGHMENFLNRVAVYDAVLDEQEAQQARNCKDAGKIARACEKASSDAKFTAFTRAKQDEADIQTYLYHEHPLPLHLQKTTTTSKTATTRLSQLLAQQPVKTRTTTTNKTREVKRSMTARCPRPNKQTLASVLENKAEESKSFSSDDFSHSDSTMTTATSMSSIASSVATASTASTQVEAPKRLVHPRSVAHQQLQQLEQPKPVRQVPTVAKSTATPALAVPRRGPGGKSTPKRTSTFNLTVQRPLTATPATTSGAAAAKPAASFPTQATRRGSTSSIANVRSSSTNTKAAPSRIKRMGPKTPSKRGLYLQVPAFMQQNLPSNSVR
jgi:hypothetical protein